jgi:hypothetical protein
MMNIQLATHVEPKKVAFSIDQRNIGNIWTTWKIIVLAKCDGKGYARQKIVIALFGRRRVSFCCFVCPS